MQQVTEEEEILRENRERRLPPIKEFQRDYRAGKASTRIRYLYDRQFYSAIGPRDSPKDRFVTQLTHLQMRPKDRDAAGNIAEPKRHAIRRYNADVVVGIVVRPRRVEATSGSAEDDSGPGGTEVEEGEGAGEGARESGEGPAKGGREGGED